MRLANLYRLALTLALLAAVFAQANAAELPTDEVEAQAMLQPRAKRDLLNLRINPQGLLYGAFGAALDVAVFERVAVGFNGVTFHGQGPRSFLDTDQYGLQAQFCFGDSCFRNCWYLRAGATLIFIESDLLRNGDTYRGTYRGVAYRASFGRGWRIWSGLNAGAGLGIGELLGPTSYTVGASNGSTLKLDAPASTRIRTFIEMYLAWAF